MPKDSEMEDMVDEMVRQCMDDPDALSCAIEMLEAIPPDMNVCKPELIFFTRENCPVCVEDRAKYETIITEGTAREVNSDSKEGREIMTRNNLEFTPTLALIDCKGKLIGEFFDSRIVEGEELDPAAAGG